MPPRMMVRSIDSADQSSLLSMFSSTKRSLDHESMSSTYEARDLEPWM